jgi:hypothetical protein
MDIAGSMPGWRRFTVGLIVACLLCLGLVGGGASALAQPGTPAVGACSNGSLSNGVGMSPGGCLNDYSLGTAYQFVFDQGGHAILIRTSDDKHCASWPAPSSVHANAKLVFHASSSTGVYFGLYQGSTMYARVNGTEDRRGYAYTTLSVDHGQLWVGTADVHGC